jgi:hypothetical protein
MTFEEYMDKLFSAILVIGSIAISGLVIIVSHLLWGAK